MSNMLVTSKILEYGGTSSTRDFGVPFLVSLFKKVAIEVERQVLTDNNLVQDSGFLSRETDVTRIWTFS